MRTSFVVSLTQQERAADEARHAVIPAGKGHINQLLGEKSRPARDRPILEGVDFLVTIVGNEQAP